MPWLQGGRGHFRLAALKLNGGTTLPELPVAAWLRTIDQMAVQTAALLAETEQMLRSLTTDTVTETEGHPDGSARVPEGEKRSDRGLPPLMWDELLSPAIEAMQTTEQAADTALRKLQSWQQSYAAWEQLLEQALTHTLTRSPPP